MFLVTTPVSESLDWVLHKIDSATRGNTCPTQEVDWHDTSSPISSIPTIKSHLSFTRHLTLGVMDQKDWDDPSLTNMQRFSKAYFWEHRGPWKEPRQGNSWEGGDICKIEAIQFLGWTEKPNETITEKCVSFNSHIKFTGISLIPTSTADCSVLLKGWVYLPVWWNCQSFATRLAFLVVELETFRDVVAVLAHQLHTHIVNWIISRRDQTFFKVFHSAWCAGVGPWTGTAVSALVFPPAAAVFAAGFVGFWCVCAGTGVTVSVYKNIDEKRLKKFRANMKQLETVRMEGV